MAVEGIRLQQPFFELLKKVYCFSFFSVLAWQVPFREQLPQPLPQEQELLPFFLLIIPFTTMAMKTTATTVAIMIVGHIKNTSLKFVFVFVFPK